MSLMMTPLFPGGRRHALTLSYDDGTVQDERMIALLNEHGLKATFNLNSGELGHEHRIVHHGIDCDHSHPSADRVAALYAGHEVASHATHHPALERIPCALLAQEVLGDRRALEEMVGYPVCGLAYPFGTYNEDVIRLLEGLGVAYARTVRDSHSFALPERPLEWHPTCHHNDPELPSLWAQFVASPCGGLFYLWGHSFEFEKDDNWRVLEAFAARAGGRPELWYATNIEIIRYLRAVARLEWSVEAKWVYNPSAQELWVQKDGATLRIPAGARMQV